MKTKRQKLGAFGEELAAAYLCSSGYRIVSRNVEINDDEIDIIAHDPVDDVMAFVEVKTLADLRYEYPPSINAGPRKWQCLRRAMRRWVGARDYRGGFRMDLISVAGGRVIEHLKEVGMR